MLPPNKKNLSVRVDTKFLNELKKIAAKERRTVSNLVLLVLEEYLETRSRAARSKDAA